MNTEQLQRKVEWLDEERRKDKATIANLLDRLVALENQNDLLLKQNKELVGDISYLRGFLGRFDQLDEEIAKKDVAIHRKVDEIEATLNRKQSEAIDPIKTELNLLNARIDEIKSDLKQFGEIKKALAERVEAENYLTKQVNELSTALADIKEVYNELERSIKLIEDNRRQDVKKIADIEGEVIALRRRSDEQRGKIDVLEAEQKKFDTRLNELLGSERERQIEQKEFIERQSLVDAERQRSWREWQAKFDAIEAVSLDIERQISAFDSTHRAVQRLQGTVEELVQKAERRLNEVTEIQRLESERFRQEWASFKADEQKMWTNYTLAQEEERSELNRRLENLKERVVLFEDSVQELRDSYEQFANFTRENLTELLRILKNWSSLLG